MTPTELTKEEREIAASAYANAVWVNKDELTFEAVARAILTYERKRQVAAHALPSRRSEMEDWIIVKRDGRWEPAPNGRES